MLQRVKGEKRFMILSKEAAATELTERMMKDKRW